MPRANLGQLLGNVDDPTSPIVATPAAPPSPMAMALPGKVPTASAKTPGPASAAVDDPGAGAGYLRFVRKDTRLREDQLEALTAHARRLNRKRRSPGPRVTENTLMRVAVDLLLDRIANASGEDEAALLKSVRR